MRVVYSLPHPADTLASEAAGHIVRARALLAAFEDLGHEVVRVEAAADRAAHISVGTYRRLVKGLAPGGVARRLRDYGRVRYSRHYAHHLQAAITTHRADVVLETYTSFSLAGVTACQRTGVPLVVDDVAPAWEDAAEYDIGSRRLAARTRHVLLSDAALLVAVNPALQGALLAEGVPETRIAIVGNGIADAFFNAAPARTQRRRALGIPADVVVLVYVGSFQPFHNVERLIDAFRELDPDGHRSAHLLLVGAGASLEQVRAHVATVGVGGSVTITGRVPYADVPSYMAAGDVGVLPGTADYMNPMKLYEYQAVGLPVVAPRQRTVLDAVSDLTAVLFTPADTAALRKALATLVDDGERRRHMGAAAAAATRGATWEARAETLLNAIGQLKASSREA